MSSVSLPVMLLYSLVISAVLVWLNRRGVGAGGAAVVTLAVCSVAAIASLFALGRGGLTRLAVQQWVLFVFVPSAVVLAASRVGVLRAWPWLLLFLGPMVFVMTLVVVVLVYNVFVGS